MHWEVGAMASKQSNGIEWNGMVWYGMGYDGTYDLQRSAFANPLALQGQSPTQNFCVHTRSILGQVRGNKFVGGRNKTEAYQEESSNLASDLPRPLQR